MGLREQFRGQLFWIGRLTADVREQPPGMRLVLAIPALYGLACFAVGLLFSLPHVLLFYFGTMPVVAAIEISFVARHYEEQERMVGFILGFMFTALVEVAVLAIVGVLLFRRFP